MTSQSAVYGGRLSSQTIFTSLIFFLVTLPIYFAVNLEENTVVVGAYSFVIVLVILAITLYTGAMTDRRWILVSVYAYLVLLVAFQFSLVGLLSQTKQVQREPVVTLFAMKSLLAFGIGISLLLLKALRRALTPGLLKSAPFDLAMWILLWYTVGSFLLSNAALEPRLAYLVHSLGTLTITWLVFRLYRVGKEDLEMFGKIIIGLCAILFIVGLLIFNYHETVWMEYLKVDVAYAGMGGRASHVNLPAWFNTGFVIGDEHYVINRLVSLVGNPVTLGYLFCFAYIMSLFLGRRLSACFFGGATFLTLSKGALLLLLIVTFFYLVRIRRKWLLYLLDGVIISSAVGLSLVIQSSANLHLQALINAFLHQTSDLSVASFLGHGLGTGGTMAAQGGYLQEAAELTGGESALGTMLYQLGFVGTAFYVAFFLLYRHQITARMKVGNQTLCRLAQGCATGLLINSIFQENLLNLTLYLPYLFFLAVAANCTDGLVRRETV